MTLVLLAAVTACGGGKTVPAPVISGQSEQGRKGASVPAVSAAPLPAPASNAVKVALLLPLSGPNADLGKSMLDAAQLALFTMGGDHLTLVPRDTGGTPDGAAKAARSAVDEKVGLILGPLLAAEVEAVKPIAAAANINVIAYSTATQLAGGNAFLMGFLPRDEAVREVDFAHEKGAQRFAALLPNSPYGHLMGDALREAARADGATVGRIEYLDSRLPDPTVAVQHLVGGQNAAAPGFDALLLPEGGAQLKQLAAQLKTAGLDTGKVRLLGSGLWDDSSIAGDPNLVGGWFASSPPDARNDFEQRYQAAYHGAPPRLASLAFDSAALAAVLAKSGGDNPFTRDAILNPSGFSGVDGLFRFTQAGLVQRGLAVLEIGAQGDTVVSPAPHSFATPGT